MWEIMNANVHDENVEMRQYIIKGLAPVVNFFTMALRIEEKIVANESEIDLITNLDNMKLTGSTWEWYGCILRVQLHKPRN